MFPYVLTLRENIKLVNKESESFQYAGSTTEHHQRATIFGIPYCTVLKCFNWVENLVLLEIQLSITVNNWISQPLQSWIKSQYDINK